MSLEKNLNIYKYFARYLALALLLINIVLTIISSNFSPYIYTLCICASILVLISRFFITYSVRGVFRKEAKKILKQKESVFGRKAILIGLFWLLVYLFTLFLIVFIELWLIYWMFYKA